MLTTTPTTWCLGTPLLSRVHHGRAGATGSLDAEGVVRKMPKRTPRFAQPGFLERFRTLARLDRLERI